MSSFGLHKLCVHLKEANMGPNMPVSPGAGFLAGIISLALTVWFVAFTVLVLQKLDRITDLLEKK